jgi:hypothetical protein
MGLAGGAAALLLSSCSLVLRPLSPHTASRPGHHALMNGMRARNHAVPLPLREVTGRLFPVLLLILFRSIGRGLGHLLTGTVML